MNRLKVWLFVLLVGAAAVAAVWFTAVAERGVATRALDARLEAASAQLTLAVRALSNETASVAALAARDPKLVELLHAKEAPSPRGRRTPPPAADPAAEEAAIQAAAHAARAAAEQAAGFAVSDGTTIVAASREAYARKAQDAGAGEKELVDALGAAVGGETRRGWIRWSEKLWYAAAVPAGEGAGLVLLQPVDAEWLRAAMAGAGAELVVVAPDVKPISAGARDVAALVAVASRAGAARDVGRLAPAFVNVLGFRIQKPSLLFLSGAPANRALTFPVPGLAGGTAVAAAPTAAVLAPFLDVQWTLLAGALALVVIGFLFGLLVRPAEVAAPVPPDLLAAADKIRRGDLNARAPVLAGQLGTVSAAMNQALDAAAAAARAPAPSLTQEFFAGGEKPALTPDPPAFEFPVRPRAAPAADPAPAPAATGPTLGGGAFEAAPVPAPARAVPTPAPVAAAPALLQAAARAAPPAEAGGEEQHWRDVFQDFLRVRTECGEPAEGLTFERFRAKLESNKATLVAKYACRTVRFQVYVKEGKAALKATPVR
ncbi:MXAN_5187 family protein [Anaeromyxobacter oryzae]|uniref:HAMP domain-containing protein n=1 Tax=Anaeromyxobacter oryzae TaxID=2918170 RepID=A0ABM7WZD7_9BACT|nr:MXAN_5187 family protein [Anaeromyxobacter oryzae]BDG04908.1 hypothetical protein AMOR_39040 [Anaeromyxobacter oryzae]